ncbi:uncharacterized protein K452DRAFT_287971 [Aplosporella prunicola CBS 121167]|uniref:Uncharacterized protein n=1 Tax=Aplosporella prunicola CBS 121167 TaxID=1176127 RepID=A0A6A6BCE5_9PEZI|nr:uncharacterized protein K452DRAFT_287971 [Aplosporella prunicola CBS 121167]KAF2141268.1 hypothetical protein K452DRAFT_287971 [Aplosporella prunicola CBS 121167]
MSSFNDWFQLHAEVHAVANRPRLTAQPTSLRKSPPHAPPNPPLDFCHHHPLPLTSLGTGVMLNHGPA